MPDMPTPRFRGAAVRMSIYGFLVLSGTNRENQAGMIDTELLLEISQIRGFYYRWHKMPPMLRPYALPLAASIDECVFVTEAESCYVHFQMFRYVHEADGQWTIIRCRSVPPETSLYWSLAVFEERLLLSCKFFSGILYKTDNINKSLYLSI